MSTVRKTAATVLVLALLAAAVVLLVSTGGDDSPADADRALAEDLDISLQIDERAAVGGPPPVIADAAAPSLAERSCLVVDPDPEGVGRIMDLPPGGALIETAPDAPAELALRRNDESGFPVDVGTLEAGRRAVIVIPSDESDRPWQLLVNSDARMSVCGRGAARLHEP